MSQDSYHHGNLKEALIAAGQQILSEKGLEGLSLRRVARKVGVSHTAPYNHFADKQALLAALSAAGHEQLYQQLSQAFQRGKTSSEGILIEVAWCYLQFALEDPGRFHLMFSGALEVERDHPNYVAVSQKNITLLEEIIGFCQARGELRAGSAADLAIQLWSIVHGFTNLILENQFPDGFRMDRELRDLLIVVIRCVAC
jgi:AcrR family transcriptional regulator